MCGCVGLGFSCFVCSFDWFAGVGWLLIDGFVNGGGWSVDCWMLVLVRGLCWGLTCFVFVGWAACVAIYGWFIGLGCCGW